MESLIINIIGGLVVAVVAACFGIGGTTRLVLSQTGRSRKTGKWIILISATMIIIGLALIGKNPPQSGTSPFNNGGFLLVGYGILFWIVGKIVEWWQRP